MIGSNFHGCLLSVVEHLLIACVFHYRFDARAIGFGDDIYVFGGLRRLECPSAMHTGTGMKFCGTEVSAILVFVCQF